MKFLCDKCNTRYSIGDDRVRGKILKIRCKNCANVITVREGMEIPAHVPRHHPTQAIPRVELPEAAPGPAATGALGAAFASQLSKPPPALEEEWYVSIDGNQAGPYSLAAAQRWVASKPFEAELHCWSEGFDDWLPVDKVSHFRNLRRRPAARPVTVPPPIPKVAPREEPKALFAATMASLEKSAGPERAKTPSAAGRPNGSAMSAGAAALAEAFSDEPAVAPAAVKPLMDGGDDDNLEIGEVSRVVSLADIGQMSGRRSTQANPVVRNQTASNPAIRALAQPMQPMQPMPDESMVAHSFASRHRRGLIALITVSAVLVLGVVIAVVFVASGGQEELSMGLGGTHVIDTSRPEDIVRRQLPTPVTIETATQTPATQKPRPTNRPTITTTQPAQPETGGTALDPGEIEAMAAKYNEGTKRCYMRAQKGALGFEIADTKKIDVTLTIGKDGSISEVKLSKHANDEFGQCLISRIKGWRFRESRGGTFQFALAFSAS